MANKLMDNILENSINQGLKSNLKNAMETVGVKVPTSTGLWQYPDIIRKKMAVNTVNGINLMGNDCIKISYSVENDVMTYEISTSLDTYKLNHPVWATENNKWGKELNVQNLFDDLFANILPNIRGVYAGDITSTDQYGNDTTDWKNELFNASGNKTGLKPSSKYLRLYITSQQEPLYIYISSSMEELSGGYNISSSDTVEIKLDDETKKLTAHIGIISKKQIDSINKDNNE